MSKIIFVTGGSRSGKSQFAEKMARDISNQVVYLATAQALDEEMKIRIEHHQARRPPDWQTLEEPLAIDQKVAGLNGKTSVILLDCLTLWISNWMHQESRDIESRCQGILTQVFQTVRSRDYSLILVSNEVGMGIVPDLPLTRSFSDIAGRLNQFASSEADEVYFMVSGIPMKLKPKV